MTTILLAILIAVTNSSQECINSVTLYCFILYNMVINIRVFNIFQVIRITAEIHKLDIDPQSKILNQIIRNFSLKILHRPINFTMADFFVINYNLMASVKSN